MRWLSPFWKRRSGRDHFVVSSRPLRHETTNHDDCFFGEHVVVLSVEQNLDDLRPSPYMSVPYPTWYHFDGKQERHADFPWKVSSQRKPRRYLVSLVASTQSGGKLLRRALHAQCSQHVTSCYLESSSRPKLSALFARVSKGVQCYQQTIFSLQPRGDSWTRRGLFDSLLVGTIPVIFDKRTLPYSSFIPRPADVSIYIPADDVIQGRIDVVEYLSRISQRRISELQHNIERIAFGLQYSASGATHLLQAQQCHLNRACDAFDIIMEQLAHYVQGHYGQNAAEVPVEECRINVGKCLHRPPKILFRH